MPYYSSLQKRKCFYFSICCDLAAEENYCPYRWPKTTCMSNAEKRVYFRELKSTIRYRLYLYRLMREYKFGFKYKVKKGQVK